MKTIYLDKIDSTNTYCKELLTAHLRPEGEAQLPLQLPMAVIAREQLAGRGRYGKSFYSPAGGLYMSYVCETNFDLDDLQKITTIAAAIVHSVLSKYSDDLYIKPINDIYHNGHKICGILTERVDKSFSSNTYYIIVGIGINIFPNSIPEDLTDTMGFLLESAYSVTLINEISDRLAESLDSIFGSISSEKFSELIDYYNLNIK